MFTRLAVIFTLTLSAAASVMAQSTDPGRDRYRVQTFDGERLIVSHATLTGQGVAGQQTFGGADLSVPSERIAALHVYRGTCARQAIWIGVGLGVLSSVLVIVRQHSDDSESPDFSEDLTTFLVMSGGGAAIGLGVGALLPKWEPVAVGYTWSQRVRPVPGLAVTLRF